MTVSIVTCPGCRSLVLSDTAQCPKCQHVFDAERAAASSRPEPQRAAGNENEEPCPTCGEMVRKGLVRCFNCGGFMRQDIARSYQKMQAAASAVIYSPLPESEQTDSPEDEVATGDEDFELAPEFAMQPGEAVAPAPAAAGDDADEAYSLADASPKSAEAAAAEAAPPSEPEKRRDRQPDETADAASAGSDQAHSVATGGDALLNIALQEEQEETQRKKHPRRRRRSGSGPDGGKGVLVHCTCGARIRVSERHRGLLGHCPQCKTPFIVPPKSAYEEQARAVVADAEKAAAAKAAADEQAAGKFRTWMTDVAVHAVNPTKLRLKPGSLKADFQAMDVGFSPEGLLLVTLAKKSAGLFGVGGGDKNKQPTRDTVREHLRIGGAVEDVPAPAKRYFEAETLKTVAVVQPMPYIHESMFGGVPVFGEGRIAVRLPKTDVTTPELLFASFDLTGFREFAAAMRETCGLENLGVEQGVPLEDEFTEAACHYSDEKLRILEKVEFYQADPQYKVKLIGRRCQGCGLVVSEDSRKKEKIGGANGKAIAKAKCPKCGQPFGDTSLYTLDQPAPQPAEEPATA